LNGVGQVLLGVVNPTISRILPTLAISASMPRGATASESAGKDHERLIPQDVKQAPAEVAAQYASGESGPDDS
jgi:hypothetical protein